MSKVCLYAHGGSKNHGCEALVRSTIKCINKNQEDIILFSTNSKEDKEYKINDICNVMPKGKVIKRFSMEHIFTKLVSMITGKNNNYYKNINKNLIDSIGNGNLYISIGGDNYCYSGLPEELGYINKSVNDLDEKTVLWGCSIEPELLKKREIIDDLKRYSLITTRESITYEALKDAGFEKNTRLIPDTAFGLEKQKVSLPENFLVGNTIGLNMSPLVQTLEGENDITYKNFLNLIEYIIKETDMNIALIPHVVWETNNDLKPLEKLYDIFKDSGRVCIINENYNCMQLKYVISKCRMFIGARTHATIAGYSTCVPTLVLGYSVKARGIAKDIFGSEKDMVISVQSLKNENELIKGFKYIKENEYNIKKHLESFIPNYKQKLEIAVKELNKLLV